MNSINSGPQLFLNLFFNIAPRTFCIMDQQVKITFIKK